MAARVMCLVSDQEDLTLLPALAEAGVYVFQVCAETLRTRALADLAGTVITAVRPHGAQVVIQGRVDVALATGADGVNLGAHDLAVEDARRIAPHLVVGATCRARADVQSAARAGATYAALGPLFASDHKPGPPSPLGFTAVADAAGVLPLVGFGGITAINAGDVIAAGAHGVAVNAGIWGNPDPISAAKELLTATDG